MVLRRTCTSKLHCTAVKSNLSSYNVDFVSRVTFSCECSTVCSAEEKAKQVVQL